MPTGIRSDAAPGVNRPPTKRCPIPRHPGNFRCAFRTPFDKCIWNWETPCIPIYIEKYKEYSKEYAKTKCIRCGQEISITKEEYSRVQFAEWECSQCGFMNSPLWRSALPPEQREDLSSICGQVSLKHCPCPFCSKDPICNEPRMPDVGMMQE